MKANFKTDEEFTAADLVCMNPRALSCSVCIFNSSKYCPPEEREAKKLYDIERTQEKYAYAS
jgi:hypothetical protein